MESDDEILKNLIEGGIIGASLGLLISKGRGEGAMLGALAGAAIIATYKANEKARESNVPVYVEDNGNLYLVKDNHSKVFIRKLDKPKIRLKPHFKLK